MSTDKMGNNDFANDYIMNLRPYRPVPQEIWMFDSEKRRKVLKLDWNEATIEPAPEVRDAVARLVASEDFFHLYPATLNKELLKLLSYYAGVPTENVQYFASSDSLHEYIGKLYINRKDKVLILWPSYDNFRSTIEGSGAEIVYFEVNINTGFCIDEFQRTLQREKPKLVYICNPNNPIGYSIPTEQIEALVSSNTDILFVVDEAYAEFSGESSNSLVSKYENLLVTHTMSKAFALANVRFGYLVTSADNIDAFSRIRNPKNISTVTQIAATTALKHSDYMWNYVYEVRTARDWFIQVMNSEEFSDYLRVFDSQANFVLIKFKDIATKSKIYYSLRNKDIYVRQLAQSVSMLDCIRVTIGTQSQMQLVYKELKKALFKEDK